MSSLMMPKNRVVVFDLDDTLYKEVAFLKSAYREIAEWAERECDCPSDIYEKMMFWRKERENVFVKLITEYNLKVSVDDLLTMYRCHIPKYQLDEQTQSVLSQLKQLCVLGLITDGRSLTQRNKIKALALDTIFDESNVLISEETGFEKPSVEPFRYFMRQYPQYQYYYVGDNPTKDFFAPNSLGWETICILDDGQNIHQQCFDLDTDYLPKYRINTIAELIDIIDR